MKRIYLVRHAQTRYDPAIADGAALSWDADFALGGLNTFATRVVTA